ncbi:hypothetical protein D8Z79_009220 [Escherichia fergusonii]|nr:hypothetical protein D8Z79_009220 [Escherichia fergusonii]
MPFANNSHTLRVTALFSFSAGKVASQQNEAHSLNWLTSLRYIWWKKYVWTYFSFDIALASRSAGQTGRYV